MSSWILVGFVTTEPQWELLEKVFLLFRLHHSHEVLKAVTDFLKFHQKVDKTHVCNDLHDGTYIYIHLKYIGVLLWYSGLRI